MGGGRPVATLNKVRFVVKLIWKSPENGSGESGKHLEFLGAK
jgi:hypothetical protein